MFALPVDLFTPYIKGREMAIDRNWSDLNNANSVQQGWLNNDAKQLNNWFAQDTYNDRVATSGANSRVAANAATNSDYATQLAGANQSAALAQAGLNGQYQQALFAASSPYVNSMAADEALFRRGQAADRAAQGQAAIQYSPAYRDAAGRNNVAAQQYSGAVVDSNYRSLPAIDAARDAGLQYQLETINANRDLIGPNTQLQRSNADVGIMRNNYLQQNPTYLFGAPRQQPAQPTPVYDQFANQLNSLVGGLEPGRVVQVNIGGTAYNAGRDANGVFFVNANGTKQYVNPNAVQATQQPQQPQQSQSTDVFSFNGLGNG